jgi:hypothetical protein
MRSNKKCKPKNEMKIQTTTKKSNKILITNNRRPSWKTIVLALYITFLLLSTIPYIADHAVESTMKDSYEYHLTYPRDGRQTHYYVERVNTSQIGKIDLVYKTATNSLIVDTQNIKVLHIYCRSMYEDECRKVYGIDPSDNSNYYKWYFIEKNHLNVNIDADNEIEDLRFIDTPIPYEVIVNQEIWDKSSDYSYTGNYSTALSNVPSGHTNVDIYFKPRIGTPPNAILKTSRTLVPVNETINFNASESYDIDGTIVTYILDFGDGNSRSGSTHTYKYSEKGVYNVILMVIDNDELVDHALLNITVVDTSDLPEILGVVPNQVKPEDSPPWVLNLSAYSNIPSSTSVDFYWYITGDNKLLYKVSGENGTDDRILFTPLPDAFGSDLVTLWLHSTENITVSQPLWINITPVNDLPTMLPLPDLVLHYDDPYIFNYEPYVNDIETLRQDLTLEIFDGYENEYITIDGLNATFNYPQSMVGQTVYATVLVSDGEDIAKDVISIQVTSDNVPKLIKMLPDIWVYESSTKYNVFDLDDYFMDPDNDVIYFSYGFSHLEISIHPNHTVDITAASEWTGAELVTFRARDPIGAIAEDIIIVTVLPVNDPPTINGVPNFIIHYDYDYRFELTPFVHDKDNHTDDLLIIPSDTEHIRLDIHNKLVIIMNYPVEYLGMSVNLRLIVTDGLDSNFQDVKVTITDDFPPELLSPIPDIVFLEDRTLKNAFNIGKYFLDLDGDVLYYTHGNIYINITINNDDSVDFSAPKDWFGSELVYFRANDPTGALQQDLVLVTVLPVNDAPEILPIPPQYGNESVRWTLDLESYIIDIDNNISQLQIQVDDDFVIVSGTTLIFYGSSELPNEVIVTVSDGEYSVSETIEIHLTLQERPRRLTLWDLFTSILPFIIIIIIIILVAGIMIYRKRSWFEAEEVFLIDRGGTLITHLTRYQQANVDDIIFSGMFTAIQEFITDTFAAASDFDNVSPDKNWMLDELKVGKNKILIERSENTYLAVIFSGEGSKRLRRIVTKLLVKIETRFEKVLPTWTGDINQLKGTTEILSVLIKPVEGQNEIDSALTLSSEDDTTSNLISTSILPTEPQIKPKATISRPLTKAQLVKKPKKGKGIPQSKELLECTSHQTGAELPGLVAWPLGYHRFRALSNREMHKLPIAMQINPHRVLPKTIAIKKNRIILSSGPESKPSSSVLQVKRKLKRTVKVSMKDGEDFEIDPSKSLLNQLAEMEDND